MTFYEIYTSTIMKIWGDTTPPTSGVSYIQDLISNIHRKLQQDYNFWFMRAYTTWETVVDSQTYGAPAEFKEMINLQFKKEGESYFTDPMSVLKLTEPFVTQWNKNNGSVEYPEFYELQSDYITIYPAPSEIRTLHLIYWTFSSRPVAADWIEGSSTEDSVAAYLGEAISYIAASDYSLIQKDYEQAKIYNDKANELIYNLKREDNRKRQAPLQYVEYQEI